MPFHSLPPAFSDPIFAVTKLAKEAGPNALNATIGVILDESGKPIVFESVKKAAQQWSESFADPQFSYPPLQGLPSYLECVQTLVCPNSTAACSATAGGTGAMAVLLRLLKEMNITDVVLPTPAWANHEPLLRGADLNIIDVPYLIDNQPSIDACINTLKKCTKPTAILLQAGCHNPTGRDLSVHQWEELAQALADTPHIVLLDMAYQGFGRGIEEDAYPVQCFIKYNVPILIAWSASKNHCLYGLRTGAALAIIESNELKQQIEQHFGAIGRTLYSVAPTPGQYIVHLVQTDFQTQWQKEVDALRALLERKRSKLTEVFPESCTSCLQGHGMFAVLPLSAHQIEELQKQHVFMTLSGRINIAGIPENRIEEFGSKILSVC